ncbi:MAG TPA: DUF3016 domain-containing protein [Burkholderiaceae bacterium]|jgi:hypothetical protein|nr:DUF3016 domain-containing protein [Burkholderiaceae bacterium]
MVRSAALTGFALVMLSLSGGAQAASAHVNFVDPENFTDLGRYGNEKVITEKRAEIARHIEQLAARNLPADQTLQVDVLDVRLAGEDERWPDALRTPPLTTRIVRPFGGDIRSARNGTWPRIKLRYQLKQADQVLASGEESVADMKYLDRINSYSTDDSLRYEKQLLDDWFRHRLVKR